MIIVVTGLPRSGTTLMMRMLEAGGIRPYYDTSKPLEWKENGVEYLNHNIILRETDKINDLKAGDGSWLEECYGKAVKVLTPSKIVLPKGHRYKFIWCDRKIKHMVKSQRKYAKRKGISRPPTDIMITNAKKARGAGKRLLKSYPDSRLIVIDFESVLKAPFAECVKIERFLGVQINTVKMAQIVVPRPASCMPYMMEERIYMTN